MSSLSLRLGPKLNLSLLLFILLLGAATTVLVLVGFNSSQDDAALESRNGLEREGRRHLQENITSQATIGALQLLPGADWGRQSARFLAEYGAGAPPLAPDSLQQANTGARFDPTPGRISDLLIPAWTAVEGRVETDARESAVLDGFFRALFASNEAGLIDEAFRPIAIYFVSLDGVTRYYPSSGSFRNAEITGTQLGALHGDMGPAGNPAGATLWTPPYQDEYQKGLVMTAYTPVYGQTGYRGVIGVDVSLDLLTETVDSLAPSPGGYAFYVDQSGEFLETRKHELVRGLAAEGANPSFAAALKDMQAGNANVARFAFEGRDYFVAYAPFQPVGGSLALVAPVDELTSEATGVTQAIQSEGNRTLAFIILSMALLFLVALGSTAWLNRRILLTPIEALVSGTRAVAAGNFNATIAVQSKDELGDLAASFNRMIQEVRSRNDALIREITEREQTSRMLAEREESTRQIFQSVSDAIVITDLEDRVVDANQAAQEMYGYSLDELHALDPFTVVHPPALAKGEALVAAIAEGRPFRTRAESVRKDGSTFMSSLFATRATYFGRPHILSVIRDVTEEVEQQELLERRVEERTRELSLLLDVSNTVASTLDTEELFALVLDQLAAIVPSTGGSVLVLEGDELVTRYARDIGGRGEAGSSAESRRFTAEGLRHSFSALLNGKPIVVANVRGETAFARDFRWVTGAHLDTTFANVVAWMALPMVHKGRFIGFIGVSSNEGGAFSEASASLGMAIANQAAIAIENARLFAEAERRAAEMTALSRVATSLDLEKSVEATLKSVAQRVVESTHAVAASLSTVDSAGMLALGGEVGLPEGFFAAIDDAIRKGAPRPNQQALASHKPVIIEGVRAGIAREPLYAQLGEKVAGAEWDAIVIVPMRYGDRDLGTLETYYRPGELPDEREVGLITAMARQAATAIENAMLFAQTEKRVRQLEALTHIASSFSLELSLQELMDRMAAHIVRATTAVTCAVALDDGPGGGMRMLGADGVPDGFGEAMRATFDKGGGTAALRAMAERRTIYLAEALSDRIDDPRYAGVSEHFGDAGWDSVLLAPISYANEALGVLVLGYPGKTGPDEEERTFVEAVADQTGLVVENARLYERASAAAALEERQRLARELHDSVSQALYGIALGARTARRRLGDGAPSSVSEPLDYVLSLAEAGLTEMRALIFELRPESIAQEGLVAAIGRQVAATQARYGVSVTAHLCDEPEVSLDLKEAAYRIAQESMHNTVKHARATRIDLTLSVENSELRLEITDDGQGFNVDGEFPGHLGLQSMRERARDAGGTLEVESAAGAGTRITLQAPVR